MVAEYRSGLGVVSPGVGSHDTRSRGLHPMQANPTGKSPPAEITARFAKASVKGVEGG